jgi:sulfite oxidase
MLRTRILLKAALAAIAATSLTSSWDEAPGTFKSGLPEYTREQVSQHKTAGAGLWVTYKHGVYDISEFVENHPGGNKILLAAGGSLEPFWNLYRVHRDPSVFAMLESMRIGNLNAKEKPIDLNDPYSGEPIRHPALAVMTDKPYNAEVPLELLVETFLTPNELFYVRNHLPVPTVDAASYRLELVLPGSTKTLSLAELASRHQTTVAVSIECAGNRRKGMSEYQFARGLQWDAGAISTAEWTGVRLADLLREQGVTLSSGKHIVFEGFDHDMNGRFAASIPIERALDPEADIILATKMNGEVIPIDHGFPLRAVVPGVAGVRNVKWLARIVISQDEAQTIWQQRDYKVFAPGVDLNSVDYTTAHSIQDLPLNSAICSQSSNGENLALKGYAYSGGGKHIERVDLTFDRGESWVSASLQRPDQKKAWAWTLWEASVPKEDIVGAKDVCVRAVDSAYQAQPEDPKYIWNFRGLLNHSWHCVEVKE